MGYGGSFNQPLQTHFGLIAPHWTVQVGYFILKAHAPLPVFIFMKPPTALLLVRLLTVFMLKGWTAAVVIGDNRALPVLSTVGWFFLLPSLDYTGGLVVQEVCHLVLEGVRTLSRAMHGDIRNERKFATRDGPGVVGTAGSWPRCGVPALPPHVGRSNSPAHYKRCVTVQRDPIRSILQSMVVIKTTCFVSTFARKSYFSQKLFCSGTLKHYTFFTC